VTLKGVGNILPNVCLFRRACDLAWAGGLKRDAEEDLFLELDFFQLASLYGAIRWKYPPVLGLSPNCGSKSQED
jgi:hypothetical protein